MIILNLQFGKKTKGIEDNSASRKLFELDFEPLKGWSYYRIREELNNGKTNYTPSIPVFIGIEQLKKAMRIAPKSLVKDKRYLCQTMTERALF